MNEGVGVPKHMVNENSALADRVIDLSGPPASIGFGVSVNIFPLL